MKPVIMKFKKWFLYLLITAGILLISACTDILELEPVSSIGVENMWQTPQQAEGGRNAMYHRLRAWVASQEFYILGSGRSQEHGWTYNQNPSWKIKYFENTVTAENFEIDWQTPYKIIGLANQIIDKVPQMEDSGDQAQLDSFLGEAYATRAYVYFVLAKTWGGVPLEIEPVEGYDPETTFKERAPANEVFDLIKSDIERALDLLPNNGFTANRARWSVPAVNTLKGDVYLWTGKVLEGSEDDIDTALTALEEVQNYNVRLLDNLLDVFDYDNKGNEEVIFAVHFNLDEWGNNHYYRMWAREIVFEEAGEEFVEEYGPGPGPLGQWWGASEFLVDKFAEYNDPRGNGVSFVLLPNTTGQHGGNWPMPTKYQGTVHEGSRRFVDDIILYRYADVLLLVAEARNALGQDPSEEINEVRERAYGDDFTVEHEFTSGSQDENNEAILRERFFELAFESKLWWDFVRFDKAYEEIPSLQGRTNVPLLFPVESQTMVRNSRITQTPGY